METLTIRRVALDTLHADPANARLHGERNMEAITASLQRFNQCEPLVVQRSTQRIIGGNGRLVAMRALGWTECDIVEVDLDDAQATALAIPLNRTGELAEWDNTALARLLESLKADGALDAAGYTDDEMQDVLDELLRDSAIEVNQDDVPAQPDAATSKRGDVWIIGRHRIMCGDSANPDGVATLLAGAPIHLVNLDAPYNVKVEPRSNNAIAAGFSSFASEKATHHQRFDHARNCSDCGLMVHEDGTTAVGIEGWTGEDRLTCSVTIWADESTGRDVKFPDYCRSVLTFESGRDPVEPQDDVNYHQIVIHRRPEHPEELPPGCE